jgi:hypothetical protein
MPCMTCRDHAREVVNRGYGLNGWTCLACGVVIMGESLICWHAWMGSCCTHCGATRAESP